MTTAQTLQTETTTETQTTPALPKPFEVAVDAFQAAHSSYKMAEEELLSGEWLPEGQLRDDYKARLEDLRTRLEDRNAKMQTAKSLMRDLVRLEPGGWRGWNGRPQLASYKGFEVTSVTKRSYDAETLFKLCKQEGVLERLLALTGYDKENRPYKLVEQKWVIDYDGVRQWLQQQELHNIHLRAYDEREDTPRVSGAKKLAFLGEAKDKE